MRYKFTDKELNKIIKNMAVIVDTREQNNNHIIDFFEEKKIKYIVKKLDFGDYSCMLSAGSFEGQQRDIYFDRSIVIERKAHIDELAGNLRDDGARIKAELAHLNKYNVKYNFYIEDPNYFENIRLGNYRSQYEPKTLYRRIKKGIEARYNTKIIPVSKAVIGGEIYETLQAFIYETFKNKNLME